MLFGKTSTAGWVLAATENKDSEPDKLSMAKLLRKAWDKRIKISKFYDNLKKRLVRPNTVVTLKALIVLQKYFIHGPPDALAPIINPTQPKDFLFFADNMWGEAMGAHKKDFFRNHFYTTAIQTYLGFLVAKHQFMVENSNFF